MLQLSFVNFTANSYMLIEGTPTSDHFFIIQSGKVRCYSELSIPGLPSEVLGPGDFVGVVSCMSGRSETKNVVAITPVTAIMVKKSQYPELIMKNTPIALKIVRAFARDMRIINDQLTKVTLNKTNIDSPEQLYQIANSYDETGHPDIATYGYYQYIKECPGGLNIDNAKKRFVKLKPRSKAVHFESSADQQRVYPSDTMIFSECQHGQDMFIIQEGSVRITKVVEGNEVILAILNKGDMFGEMALLENKPRSASAIAHETCKLMVVNRANFDQMVSTQPQMISKLTNMLAERMWAMYRQLGNTQLKDMREKMIDMIALQIEKQKVQVLKGSVYNTGMSVMDLFKFCSIPQSQQGQAARLLASDQNVKIDLGKIMVPDVPNIIKQAAFYRKQLSKRKKDE